MNTPLFLALGLFARPPVGARNDAVVAESDGPRAKVRATAVACPRS